MNMDIEVFHAGQVRRYHANPEMAPLGQTTADHSWGVTALIILLNPDPSSDLLKAAIFHDSGERWAGDLPYPFKLQCPTLAEQHAQVEVQLAAANGVPQYHLTADDERWLKLADRLEAMLYARLHRPNILSQKGWQAQTADILKAAAALGCSHKVQQMIGGN